MPSSSPAPKPEPGTMSSQASSVKETNRPSCFTIKNRALEIDSTKPATKLSRQLVPLHGSVIERHWWRYFGHLYPDARERPPHTLQYICGEWDDLLSDAKRQDSIREALWTALEDIDGLDEQAKITFSDHENHQTESLGEIINLTFTSSQAFLAVNNGLKEILFRGQDGQQRRFAATSLPSVLAGNIFIFDCVNVPVDSIPVKSLFSALAHMTQELGSLAGMAKVVLNGTDDSDFEAGVDTVRGYLELDRAWIAVPLQELVNRFPSHFVWMGRPHQVLFTGYTLREKPLYSADYPLDGGSSAGPSASQASTKKRKSQG